MAIRNIINARLHFLQVHKYILNNSIVTIYFQDMTQNTITQMISLANFSNYNNQFFIYTTCNELSIINHEQQLLLENKSLL